VDYVTGLEALCGRENDAVSYRIPLRVATLIGRDANERAKVFDVADDRYKQRSKIAHGSGDITEPLDDSGTRLLQQLQAILFRTIHTSLALKKQASKSRTIIGLLESAIRTQDRTKLDSKIRPEFL
jgi:hypothetical protein